MYYTRIAQHEDEGTTYGIALVGPHGATLEAVPALTSDRLLAARYVMLMNELRLSPDHFQDVVNDIRAELVRVQSM